MDRRDFLKASWRRGILPLVKVAALFLIIFSFYEAITENGDERWILQASAFFVILILCINIFTAAFSKTRVLINNLIPEPIKNFSKAIKPLLDYVLILTTGAVIYHLWFKDTPIAIILFLFLIYIKIKEMIIQYKNNKGTNG